MHVVPEEGGTGMNEFYVECRMKGPVAPGRELVPVTPTAVVAAGLLVSAIKEQA